MSYIGIDVGTSGCKAAVMEADGSVVASARREYAFVVPRPGWAELDPAAIWRAVAETLAELAPAAGAARSLAVSTIGEALVLTDGADRVLHNAITYVDCRCEGTLAEIEAALPARELHAVSGVPLNQMYSLNKVLWLRRHRPEVLERTRKAFLFVDYLGYLLTGERLVDPASASRTMLLDARSQRWSDRLMRLFGVDRNWFSPIAPPGSRVGALLPAVARDTGLPAGMTVTLGCHDHPCGTLGSGTIEVGDIFLGVGSSESLSLVIPPEGITDALLDNKMAFEPFFGDRYFISSGQLTHGTSIRWFVELFRRELAELGTGAEESLYALADRLCAPDAAALYFLPYMSGVDPNDGDNDARGCFVGLDVTMDKWRMYRAVLEGLCFETRMRLDRLAQGGARMGVITAAGGGAKSDLLMQMKADVMERPLRVLEGDEACIKGLGMICAVAAGDYAGYAEATARFIRHRREFRPGADYAPRYRTYKIIHNHIRALYRDLR